VLADYRRSAPDNMMGRFYGLQNRLESEPMPELFDDPIASWLPASNDHDDDERDHRIEISHLLDHALASAIGSVPKLSASRLWRWALNVRRESWSNLKEETSKALVEWLAVGPEREVAFFDEILAGDDPADGPWLVSHKYITTARRQPSAVVVQHLLNKAAANTSERKRLLAIAVEIAVTASDESSYWATYDQVILNCNETLLSRLTTSNIDEWRRDQSNRTAKSNKEEERQRIRDVDILRPILSDMAVGRYPQNLTRAAHFYFERGESPDIQRIVDKSDTTTTVAILAGWNHIATKGLGDVDAAKLGAAEAGQRRYHVEVAAVAGIYRLLIDGKLTALRDTPIEVALAVLKSGWIANGDDRRQKLDRWAINRLNINPAAGAAGLVDYWNAALGAGATDLPGIWQLQPEGPSSAVSAALERALDTVLKTRPTLEPNALRSAVRASTKIFDKKRLIDLARAALDNSNVGETGRNVWMLVAFVLDPVANAELMTGEHSVENIALFLDDANSELIGALSSMADVDRLPTRVLMIRALGSHAAPSDEFSRGGLVTEPQRLSETVRNAIDALAGDSRPEAGKALVDLASNPHLVEWHPAFDMRKPNKVD
jgi:hypothetical protein